MRVLSREGAERGGLSPLRLSGVEVVWAEVLAAERVLGDGNVGKEGCQG